MMMMIMMMCISWYITAT